MLLIYSDMGTSPSKRKLRGGGGNLEQCAQLARKRLKNSVPVGNSGDIGLDL